ncbi:30S ribosomal protein S12 methylthiotransferase RimO [Calycomorphotria hydatis]|uniref:Ribosomal protein uS12 methylthiotransferase RimO n=1 Tax=Calycomorphotria hydatis TaxID=2528027 RepID=A0A517T7S6_9PLAN|nr:30S ribosomal protein S12 methylthiotransferase RimO [Calycomorphotria hydatis]QDT64428.1 Ribosomal protein S12 methylthiotransferase RimO [Calycomorphotria hydatis]
MSLLPIIDPSAASLTTEDSEQPTKGTYAFVSLGCPKNLVDSEKMLGHLAVDGYSLVSDPDGADFVIVNTCGFIDSSRAESRSVIDDMLDLKRAGRTKGVIVAGCLPERVGGANLREEFPEVDHIVGVFARDEISRVADRLVGGVKEQREVFRPAPIRALDDRQRLRITPQHYAYLKISEGCNRTCTFCSIPMMRGKHATKPIEEIVAEARELAADGVRELILVAQDTTYYGIDLYGEMKLVELLDALEQVDGIQWIRMMYLYPVNFTDQLIEKITTSSKVIPYLDMPLQHINSRVLKRMSRRVNQDKTIALVRKLRASISNLVLRTTFIVGFPGETDAEFEDLVDFVEEARFERMGVFPYSIEEGTPAVKLDGHLPDDVKTARYEHLMGTQQQIAFDFAESLIGYELDVHIDGVTENGLLIGRTYADAPDIDASVYVGGDESLVGQMVPVELTESDGYDWGGEAIVATTDDAGATS